jgi:PKD repeat protein
VVKIHKVSEIKINTTCTTPIRFVKKDNKPGTYTFSTDQKPANSKFYWYFGDGGNSTDISPVYTFKKTGTWVVHLKIIDENEKICYGETKATFEGETNPTLSGKGKVKKLNPAGCDFAISTESGLFIPTNLPSGFILKDGMYVEFTYEKLTTKSNNCTEAPDIKILTIKEIPVTPTCSFDIVVKPKEANPNTFKFNILGLTDIKNLKWTFGDGTAGATTQDPEHIFLKAGIYEVKCTIITNSGCTVSRVIKVTVLLPPISTCKGAISLTLFDPTDNKCNGTASVKLMDGEKEMAGVTYLWSNGQKGNSAKELCKDKPYTVQAVIDGICQKTTSFTMLSKPMFKAASINGLSNFSVIEPKEGIEYEWIIGNGIALKGAEVNYDFLNDGVYDVTLKAISGSDVSEFTQQIVIMKSTTGTELINKSELRVYPNPASENLNINFGNPVSGNLFIEVMNMAGQRSFSQQIFTDGLDYATVNLKQLKSGIYFLRITNGKQLIADRKFIKAD